MKKAGFSLVELSIVLVIIGLLIAGVMVGKSLVSTGKIQNYVKSLQKYEIAVQTFKTNFQSEPGDDAKYAPYGNQNGRIDTSTTGSCTDGAGNSGGTYSNDEATQVWAHLSSAQMMDQDYAAYQPTACGGSQSPAGLAGVNGPIFAVEAVYQKDEFSISGGLTQNVPIRYSYDGQFNDGSEREYTSTLNAAEAHAVDTIMDDGNTASGAFYGFVTGFDDCDYYAQANSRDASGLYCTIYWLPDHKLTGTYR